MNKAIRSILPLAIILAVSACCSEEGRKRAGAAGTQPVELPLGEIHRDESVPGMALVYSYVEGAVFEPKVENVVCKDNHGDIGEVRIKWTAPEGVSFTRISAAAANQEPKTWVDGGASGDQVTGQWITSGSSLVLYNASTQARFAQIKIETTPCSAQ
ncbi:hypothetical protein [Stenotrophomonas sp. OVS01A]|uniref:hypothetical protein n=1 Tax=Stenotrophomonas sp. OVS01A TaxID=2862680 RepID=UPI001CBE8CA7|nr:hypothetical protein [Stenotrophomonas sp. OVS01A]